MRSLGTVCVFLIVLGYFSACRSGGEPSTPDSSRLFHAVPSLTPISGACRTELGAARPGPGFVLDETRRWQICHGKADILDSWTSLVFSEDNGASWRLLSHISWGRSTPVPGVGRLPGGRWGVTALFFLNESQGWLGSQSPAPNLYRTSDGGVTWIPAHILQAEGVVSIDFEDMLNGHVVGQASEWITDDGGDTWIEVTP